MARTDANPPMPEFRSDYVLYEVDAQWLSQAEAHQAIYDLGGYDTAGTGRVAWGN